ncbi:hypothetical protein D1872_220950 [compost metagenome]
MCGNMQVARIFPALAVKTKPLHLPYFQHICLQIGFFILSDAKLILFTLISCSEPVELFPDFKPRLNGQGICIVPSPTVNSKMINIMNGITMGIQYRRNSLRIQNFLKSWIVIRFLHLNAKYQFFILQNSYCSVMGKFYSTSNHWISPFSCPVLMFKNR